MAEEKEKIKKKEWVVWKIVRWVWRVFLVGAFVLGLWFHSPVKALCVPVIFLLGCTALPRVYRKWFWAGVAVIIISCIVWVFLPESDKGWEIYKYDFSKELEALEAIHAVPDDENAALLYKKLLANYEINEPNIYDVNLLGDLRRKTWRSEDYPELAQWLEEQEPIIKELLEISQMEKCLFPIYDPLEMADTIRYSNPRQYAYLLIYSANNDAGEGRINDSLKKHEAMVQIGKHMNQQPTMIDTLIGTAIESLGLGQVKRLVFLDDISQENLEQIELIVQKVGFEWKSQFLRILEHEKLSDKSFFARFYEKNEEGKTRFARDPIADFRETYRKQFPDINEPNESGGYQYNKIKSMAYPSYWQKKLFKAGVLLYWFSMPKSPEYMSDAIDRAFEKFYLMAEDDYDWSEEKEWIPLMSLFSFGSIFNPNYLTKALAVTTESMFYHFHDIHLRLESDKNGVLLLIGLRRYKDENGKWPERLEEIRDYVLNDKIFTDPVNGSNFVYKVTEDGVMLYSKGENNIDENGENDMFIDEKRFKMKQLEDDRMIWPLDRIDKENKDG